MPLRHPLVVGLMLLAPAAAQAPDAQTQVAPAAAQPPDLQALFAPPLGSELAAVRAEWAERRNLPKGWRVEASGQIGSHDARVISHVVDGHRHYGLVRLPRHFTPGGTFPVLVYLHGGAIGASIAMLDQFDSVLSVDDLPDEFVYIAPSFRGEALVAGPLGTYQSEGPPSRLDRDVDDAMALLSVVLQTIPEADRLRVGVFGTSRGGGVALLFGARDERVRLLASSAGVADLLLGEIQDSAAALIASRQIAEDPVMRFVMKTAVEPYVAGQLDLHTARHLLLRSSPARFAAQMPEMQIHHGRLDEIVPMAHPEQLALQCKSVRNGPRIEFWRYPQGGHTLGSMPGTGRRLNSYFVRLLTAPASYCRDAARDGARLDFLGEPGIAANDWHLTVTDAPASEPGVFLMGSAAAQIPLSSGLLCLAPPFRRIAPVRTGPDGSASVRVDLAALVPGSTWHFQFAYCSGGNGGNGPAQGLSDALRVTFSP